MIFNTNSKVKSKNWKCPKCLRLIYEYLKVCPHCAELEYRPKLCKFNFQISCVYNGNYDNCHYCHIKPQTK